MERRGFYEAQSKDEALTTLSAFPRTGGMTSCIDYRTRRLDLSAQKRSLSAHRYFERFNILLVTERVNKNMDVGLIVAIMMLVVWAVLTFVVNDAPGMTHALLTAGVALLVWRVVKRGSRADQAPK
jgi:hypothetical protein